MFPDLISAVETNKNAFDAASTAASQANTAFQAASSAKDSADAGKASAKAAYNTSIDEVIAAFSAAKIS